MTPHRRSRPRWLPVTPPRAAPRVALLFLAFALLLAACGGPPGDVTPDVRVEVAPSELTVTVGASETLTATVTGGTTNEATWSSSDESVATVDEDGTVTGVSVGEAEVTATSTDDPSVSDSAAVTVIADPDAAVLSVTVDPAELGMVVGDSATLSATVEVTGSASRSVLWASSDATVASVDADGVVTAVGAGTTTVIVTSTFDPSRSATATVTVTAEPTVLSVTVDPAEAALLVGDTVDLTATVVVTGGLSQDVTWTSNDPDVATVDAGGTVTAAAAGTAVVTATSDADPSVSGSATVTVTSDASVLSVTIDQAPFELFVGATETLTATVVVTGGLAQDVTWTSDDETVATVDASSGVVTAVATGDAVITATSVADGSVSDSVVVTVPPQVVESVTIDQAPFELFVGATESLSATVVVSGGASPAVTWSSDDEPVATVDPSSGEVTAVAAGDAVITATSVANPSVSDSVVVTVPEPTVASVAIDGGDATIQVGASRTLTATVTTTGGASPAVTWSSDDTSVATVGEDSGELTGVAVGEAEITATSVADPSQSASVTVTVTAVPVTSVSGLTAQVVLGSQVQLDWSVENADTLDVVCSDGPEGPETTLETGLSGTTTSVTLPIPDSDCQTIRILATGDTTDDASVLLAHVVTHGGDDGPGSLRAIVGFGSGAPVAPGTVIGFASDVDEVVLAAKDFVSPHDAHMFLEGDFAISGRASDPVTIRSDDTFPDDESGAQVFRSRLFYVLPGATVHLDALILRDGTFIGNGGAIRNEGDLTITNSELRDNRAWIYGGAVSNFGTLLIEDSILENNVVSVTDGERSAPFLCVDDADRTCSEGDDNYIGPLGTGGSGGALYNGGGTTTLVDTVIRGNLAMFSGGGIYVTGGTVEMTGGEVDGNTASDATVDFGTFSYGGGVANAASEDDGTEGTVSLTNVLVTGNVSQEFGGGLSNGTTGSPDLTMTLDGVTVTANAADPDTGFGGGAINYHSGDPGNLAELGSSSITGNSAANGPDRYDSDVTLLGLSVQSADGPSKPIEPAPSEFQMRR